MYEDPDFIIDTFVIDGSELKADATDSEKELMIVKHPIVPLSQDVLYMKGTSTYDSKTVQIDSWGCYVRG